MSHKPHEEEEHKGEGGHGGSHGGGHGGGGHGGGGHEEHEGAPEWLISFADNVTLMMGFFVILLAMNMKAPTTGGIGGNGENGGPPSSPDMIDAALAIRAGFNNPVNLASTDPNDLPLIRRVLERLEEGYSNTDGVPGSKHDVESIRQSNRASPCGSLPFKDGSHELGDSTKTKAQNIARRFAGTRLIIEVRGHCSAREAAGLADRGMDLCFKRASAVAAVLRDGGIDERQIRLMLCGDHDRSKELSYDPKDQQQNQRVEVTFTDELMPTHVPTGHPFEPMNEPDAHSQSKPEAGPSH